MGQSLSRLKTFSLKCYELLPSTQYKRLISEQKLKILELESLVSEQHKNVILKQSQTSDPKLNENLLELTNKVHQVHHDFQMFQSQLNAPKLAIVKGNEGEDFVLSCLKEAFPNNTGIIKTSEHKCGDIIFRVENSDKLLMFEVKNTHRNVNAINNGKDYEKFFSDLHNPSINLSGGILISLNGTVDINTPSREPRLDRGKPFMFIDNLKQFPDPVCLLHVVVTMMIFMVKYSGSLQDTNLRLQLDTYAKQTERLMKVYKELMYNHKKQAKNIESLRSEIEDMQYILTEAPDTKSSYLLGETDVKRRPGRPSRRRGHDQGPSPEHGASS